MAYARVCVRVVVHNRGELLSLPADIKLNGRSPNVCKKRKGRRDGPREIGGNARRSTISFRCERGCFASIEIGPFFPGSARLGSPFVSRGGTYPSFGGVIYKSLQHERQVTVPLERYLSACTSYEHDLVRRIKKGTPAFLDNSNSARLYTLDRNALVCHPRDDNMEISFVTRALACQTFVALAGHEAFYIYACIYGDVAFPLWSRAGRLVQ